MYCLSIKKVKEINGNLKLIKEEAIKMKACFVKQGNEEHSIEMTANYSLSMIIDKTFYRLVEQYKML